MNCMKIGNDIFEQRPTSIQQFIVQGKIARAQATKEVFLNVVDRIKQRVRAARNEVVQPGHHIPT